MIKEITKMDYHDGRELNEAKLVKIMLKKYNIKEVTTQRQANNGTREFEFPVSKITKQSYNWYKKRYSSDKPLDISKFPRLRLAIFNSGYVRNQNSCYSSYQINPTYKRQVKHVFSTVDDNGNISYKISKGKCVERALIFSSLTRLIYMLDFYLRNSKNYMQIK